MAETETPCCKAFQSRLAGMRLRSKFAALAKAIRHWCRKASAALRCLDLRLHHCFIPF